MNGRWNPSIDMIQRHLLQSHGIDPTGYSLEEMLTLHDNDHNRRGYFYTKKKTPKVQHEVTNARNPKPPRLTAQFDGCPCLSFEAYGYKRTPYKNIVNSFANSLCDANTRSCFSALCHPGVQNCMLVKLVQYFVDRLKWYKAFIGILLVPVEGRRTV